MSFTRAMYEAKDAASNTESATSMMCLANMYRTGYHCIDEHSDDCDQMSSIRDVVCWVIGAPRRLIIRSRKAHGHKKLLCVGIPTGIYIMKGEWFQRTYTHEIPREKESMYNRLCAIVPREIMAQGKLHAADWLAEHPEEIAARYPKDVKDYTQWRNPRCSYTVRFFAAK